MGFGSNETSVKTTTVGAALSVILIMLVTKLGVKLGPAEVAGAVAAFTTIFNWVIPEKKWFNRES